MEEDVKNMTKEELLEYLEDISLCLNNIALDQIPFAIQELKWWNEEYKAESKGFRDMYDNVMKDYNKIKQELDSVKELYYTQAEIDKNYIPKAKVTEAIREYQKRRLELADGSFFADPSYINNDTALVIGISVLQDLLQKKGEI